MKAREPGLCRQRSQREVAVEIRRNVRQDSLNFRKPNGHRRLSLTRRGTDFLTFLAMSFSRTLKRVAPRRRDAKAHQGKVRSEAQNTTLYIIYGSGSTRRYHADAALAL